MTGAAPVFPGMPGVSIAGTGSFLPERILRNSDLEKMMDTTDEWIVQRTGIRTRHIADRTKGESVTMMAANALRAALENAKLGVDDLDLILVVTMTPDIECPPVACLVANELHATHPAGFDLNGACSGYLFGLNTAHALIRAGTVKTIGLIGVDHLSRLVSYTTAGRGTAILFGDGASAAILRAVPDPARGIIAQSMHVRGSGWKDIHIPKVQLDMPPGVVGDPRMMGYVHMNGAGVFKFAVGTFPDLIEETLERAGLTPGDITMYLSHQSNARILSAARDKFGIPPDKLHINIDRVGNTVSASLPLCLDEVRRAGRIPEGSLVMFLAFGAGLTWGSSLWRM